MTSTSVQTTLPENDKYAAAKRFTTKANNNFTAFSRLSGRSENNPSTAINMMPSPAPKYPP